MLRPGAEIGIEGRGGARQRVALSVATVAVGLVLTAAVWATVRGSTGSASEVALAPHGAGPDALASLVAYAEPALSAGTLAILFLGSMVAALAAGRARALGTAREGNRALALAMAEACSSRERLAVALAASEDGYFDWDLRTGEVQHSPRHAELLGISPEDLAATASAWTSRMHPEDLAAAAPAMEAHLAGRTPQLDVEYRVRTAGGAWRWIRSRAKVVERDADGRPMRLAGTVTDVQARKGREQAEEEIRLAQGLAQSTLDAMVQRICVVDERGTILAKNESWRAVEQARGAPPLDPPAHLAACDCAGGPGLDHAAEFTAGVHAVLRGERPSFELDYRCSASGEERWFFGRATRSTGPGPRRVVVAHHDRTERKRMELERERLLEEAWTATERREQMLAVVAHDLRSPLAAVRFAGHGLERLGHDAGARASLREREEIIQGTTERMGRLIEDLLDVAAIQSGRLRLAPSANDLASIAGELRRAAASLAQRREVALELEVRRAPGLVRCDRVRITQVLSNLVSNALHATGPGGRVTLTVDGTRDEAVLSVVDTGRGLPSGWAERIFEAYQRGPDPGYKGAGLGLAIAKGIVDGHGGRIWAEPAPGGGAAFRVALPLT